MDLDAVRTAIAAVAAGEIDASFRAVHRPVAQLPGGVQASRVYDEPVQLLTGPDHPFAAAGAVTPAQLAGHQIWMPGIVPGTEWAAFVGEQTHLSWPAGYGLRRVPLRDPVPVYPHALLWRQDNPHPTLAVLRGHLRRTPFTMPNASTWTPAWA